MTDMILGSWRDSTKTQYNTYLKQWDVFCKLRQKRSTDAGIAVALDFLYELHSKGLGYSALNTARSAISSIMTVGKNKIDFGAHKLVCQFMKGVFNSRPSLPRYAAIWDPDIVLQYLRKLRPCRRLPLKLLTMKVVVLLALLTVQRVQTLHLIRLENISITADRVQIVIDDKVKTSRPTWHLKPIVFTKYTINKSLCIVRYLKAYIDRTESLRGSESQLFISFQKPHRKVTKCTISRWIKLVLRRSGVDVSMYKAHSTRAASASKASEHVSIDKILKAGGWSSSSSYMKHYNLAPLCAENSVQEALVKDA